MAESFSLRLSSVANSFVSSSETPAATRASTGLVSPAGSEDEQLRTQLETPTMIRTRRTMARAPRMKSWRSMPKIRLRPFWKLMLRARTG